ncbi:MAG: prephenate dehydratase domain-containing protein [Nanoarchaeota archaeon]
MRLGCLDKGSNSERVARRVVNSRDLIISFRDMQEVFDSLKNGMVDYAVVPVENSITGEIHYKLEVERFGFTKVGEHIIDIRHCLASKSKDIGFILSHPEALKQCRKYLERFSQVYIGETGSTAEAARFIVDKKGNGAAIADYQTCVDYGLNIIEGDIVKNNRSLFWIVKNG